LEVIREDWTDAGMPEVLLQSREVAGAWSSTSCQIFCLKAGVSGPCSWIISAFETAEARSGLKRSLEDVVSDSKSANPSTPAMSSGFIVRIADI
jgi:hypothetical protein